MFNTNVNVVSFEAFLAEDTKELAHKGHSRKNGDGEGEDLKPVVSDDGSAKKDVVEKSNDSANGDGKGENLNEAKDVAFHEKHRTNAEDKINNRLDKNPYPGKLHGHGGWINQVEKHFKNTNDHAGLGHVAKYKEHDAAIGKL